MSIIWRENEINCKGTIFVTGIFNEGLENVMSFLLNPTSYASVAEASVGKFGISQHGISRDGLNAQT